MKRAVLSGLVLICTAIGGAQTQSLAGDAVTVTADNFNRAETDMYFAMFVKRGELGKFVHLRDLPLEGTGVRPNRDTFYSEGVFDLDAGPVKITLPKSGKRFMSMMAINENHYVFEVAYGGGNYTYTRAEVGTRYLFVALRTLVNPADPQDVKQAHALQDAVVVKQKSPGRFEVTNWDPVSHKKVRDLLLGLNTTLPDLQRAFGTRTQVDPVRHLIATASAWGGNPDKDAIYLNITPEKNDGAAIYKLNVPAKVPVDAFWSVTVYDETGHFQKNQYNAYSLNSITGKKSADGSVAVQFGGCDGKIPNCLPTMKGWNYMVRLYRPRDEILNGKWKFPEAQAVN
ncbi:MAG TPA: DUF1214 domain-containing protein [Pseudolabrys sp.]|nr:DUF1214 domain-containing protein [Pseudolabrys sp.]